MHKLKFAGVQMDVAIGDFQKNLDRIEQYARTIAAKGAWLTVFPECTTTGYCFESFEEALPFAEPVDGPAFNRIWELCKELQTRIVYGFLESSGGEIFNSISLVGPDGLVGTYRKVHLPMLGIDRFTTAGDKFAVFETDGIKIGLCICYDSSFPESARVMALDGADVIVLPTNWPPTSGLTADVIPAARALENHVYFLAVNRVGNERGFEFIGKSSFCSPSGKVLVQADHNCEEILYAEFNPLISRNKHLVNIPGQHEVHRIQDRCPGSYARIQSK